MVARSKVVLCVLWPIVRVQKPGPESGRWPIVGVQRPIVEAQRPEPEWFSQQRPDIDLLRATKQQPRQRNPITRPAPESCPFGWEAGDLSAEIPGCGVTGCNARHDLRRIEDCAHSCSDSAQCNGFSWGTPNVCTIYSSSTPTTTNTEGQLFQLFCKRGIIKAGIVYYNPSNDTGVVMDATWRVVEDERLWSDNSIWDDWSVYELLWGHNGLHTVCIVDVNSVELRLDPGLTPTQRNRVSRGIEKAFSVEYTKQKTALENACRAFFDLHTSTTTATNTSPEIVE